MFPFSNPEVLKAVHLESSLCYPDKKKSSILATPLLLGSNFPFYCKTLNIPKEIAFSQEVQDKNVGEKEKDKECLQERNSIEEMGFSEFFKIDLIRSNEMMQALRSQLKKSEEQLATPSDATSFSCFEEDSSVSKESYKELVKSLKKQIIKLKESRKKKISQLLELTEALNVAQVNCTELHEYIKTKIDFNKKLPKKLEENRTQIIQLEAHLQKKKEEVCLLKTQMDARFNKLNQSEEENQKLRQKISELESHANICVSDVKSHLEKTQEDKKVLEEELNWMKGAARSSSDISKTSDDLSVEIMDDLQTQKTRAEEMEYFESVRREEMLAIQQVVSRSEAECSRLEQVISKLHEKNSSLIGQLKESRDQNERAEEKLMKERDAVSRLLDQKEMQEMKNKELEEMKKDLEDRLRNLEQLQQQQKSYKDLNSHLSLIYKTHLEDTEESSDPQQILRALEQLLIQKTSNESAKDEEIKSLNQQIDHLRCQIATDANVTSSVVEKLKREVEDLKKDRDAAKEEEWKMKEQLKYENNFRWWQESRFHHLDLELRKSRDEANRYYFDARRLQQEINILTREVDVLRHKSRDRRSYSGHFGQTISDGHLRAQLATIEEIDEDEKPQSLPTSTPIEEERKDSISTTSSVIRKSPVTPKKTHKMSLEEKREERKKELRKLPIWRKENPDNWDADLSFCEIAPEVKIPGSDIYFVGPTRFPNLKNLNSFV